MVKDLIKDKAITFVGQKEIAGNMGFNNSEFAQKMKERGHKPGEAWCAYFAELCVIEALKDAGRTEEIKVIEKLFDASAVKTYNNFKTSTLYKVDKMPEVGDVVIWQNYKNGVAHWTGHAGIVIENHGSFFLTIEGNSNKSGGREGIEVCPQKRVLNFKPTPGKKSELVLKGFIHII